MAIPKPIAYSEDIRPHDTERALDTVTVKLVPDETKPWGVDFGGTCPRCGDAIQIRQWLVAVSGALKLNDAQMEALADQLNTLGVDRSTGDHSFDLACPCTVNHPHTPKDKRGCGARFRVRVTWP